MGCPPHAGRGAPSAVHRPNEIPTAGLWSLLLQRGHTVDLPFSGVADTQLMLKRPRLAGCSRLSLTVGGCRRCRHGCRKAALFLREQGCETRSVPGGEELRALQRLLQLGDLAAGAASWVSVFGSRSIRESGKTVKSESDNLQRTSVYLNSLISHCQQL